MKQRIYNRGNGWYIPAHNYKDSEDNSSLNVGFTRGTEPVYTPPKENDYTFLDIDIQEAKFNSWHRKVSQMFVFKYTVIGKREQKNTVEEQNREFAESVQGTEYADNFGNPNLTFEQEELPFY